MIPTPLLVVSVASEVFDRGISIAIAGMLIVALALTLVTLFIATLPKVLAIIARFVPEVDDPHAVRAHPDSQLPDDEQVIAAIGFVLHTEFQRQLLSESSGPGDR